MRTWDDSVPVDDDEAANLDYSSPPDASGAAGAIVDVTHLVDESSRGVRGKDGLYDLKDLDLGAPDDVDDDDDHAEEDDIIARAINGISIGRSTTTTSKTEPAVTSKSRFGSLSSLFARVTGSSRTLTKEDLEPVLSGMKDHLMQKNVAQEIAIKICEGIGESLVGKRVTGYRGNGIIIILLLPRFLISNAFKRHQERSPQCAL